MAQKRITISIDSNLNDRWNKVSKKHDIPKSTMVEEFLIQILPILETTEPEKFLQESIKKMADGIKKTADLMDCLDENKK